MREKCWLVGGVYFLWIGPMALGATQTRDHGDWSEVTRINEGKALDIWVEDAQYRPVLFSEATQQMLYGADAFETRRLPLSARSAARTCSAAQYRNQLRIGDRAVDKEALCVQIPRSSVVDISPARDAERIIYTARSRAEVSRHGPAGDDWARVIHLRQGRKVRVVTMAGLEFEAIVAAADPERILVLDLEALEASGDDSHRRREHLVAECAVDKPSLGETVWSAGVCRELTRSAVREVRRPLTTRPIWVGGLIGAGLITVCFQAVGVPLDDGSQYSGSDCVKQIAFAGAVGAGIGWLVHLTRERKRSMHRSTEAKTPLSSAAGYPNGTGQKSVACRTS